MDTSKISDHTDPKGGLDAAAMQMETVTVDDVFGEITEDGPNFRNVSTAFSWDTSLTIVDHRQTLR